MVGTRLAALKTSAAAVTPYSAPMVWLRTRPSARLTTLPSMIKTAAPAMRPAAPPAAPLTAPGLRRLGQPRSRPPGGRGYRALPAGVRDLVFPGGDATDEGAGGAPGVKGSRTTRPRFGALLGPPAADRRPLPRRPDHYPAAGMTRRAGRSRPL